MDTIAIVFALIGAIVAVVGSIMVMIAAFRISVWWGLANLFVPFASLVFLFKHWQEAKNGFLLSLLGSLIAFGAIFSTPQTKRDLAKHVPAAIKLPQIEKEKPMDLNTQIERRRADIDAWESQSQQQGATLAQQYQALDAQRKALKPDDAGAVSEFNAQAAAYSQANAAHKALRKQIDDAQRDLAELLDQRSRQKAGAKPGGAALRTVSAAPVAAAPAASARRTSAPVVIYSTSHCGWCTRAKQYFASRGVTYEERDIERSDAANADFKRLGGRGVPLIMVGSEKVEGFDQKRLDQLL